MGNPEKHGKIQNFLQRLVHVMGFQTWQVPRYGLAGYRCGSLAKYLCQTHTYTTGLEVFGGTLLTHPCVSPPLLTLNSHISGMNMLSSQHGKVQNYIPSRQSQTSVLCHSRDRADCGSRSTQVTCRWFDLQVWVTLGTSFPQIQVWILL